MITDVREFEKIRKGSDVALKTAALGLYWKLVNLL